MLEKEEKRNRQKMRTRARTRVGEGGRKGAWEGWRERTGVDFRVHYH